MRFYEVWFSNWTMFWLGTLSVIIQLVEFFFLKFLKIYYYTLCIGSCFLHTKNHSLNCKVVGKWEAFQLMLLMNIEFLMDLELELWFCCTKWTEENKEFVVQLIKFTWSPEFGSLPLNVDYVEKWEVEERRMWFNILN